MGILLPQTELDQLSPMAKQLFIKWATFLHEKVDFNMPDSLFHAYPHCERVLLYALIIGEKIFGNNPDALEALAHAAIFHDTRRLDDYLDTGHGARGAVHYEDECRKNPQLVHHPEASFMMRYHDLEDSVGFKAIDKYFGADSERVITLYKIFKDADALDRWRLGPKGLDPRYLRTEPARSMTEYSRKIVEITTAPEVKKKIDRIISRIPIMKHIAIFASGNGSNAENIIRYFRENPGIADVSLIICNKPVAGVIARAERFGVPVRILSGKEIRDPEVIIPLLEEYAIDMIVLAGFLLMVPAFLTSLYKGRIVNIHPSLLPAYGGKGMYGRHIHEAVIAAGEKKTGITIHAVTENCDEGAILFQTAIDIHPDDTPETLEARIHDLERLHFPATIARLLTKL